MVVYYGIKIVPIQKNMFLLITLMPMSIYEAASLSPDSLNLALAIFTICLFLNLTFKKEMITNKNILMVSSCLLGLALSKQIYVLIGLLFFIIPKEKFVNGKEWIKSFIFTILPSVVILIVWSSIVSFSAKSSISSIHSQITTPFFLRLMNSLILSFSGYVASFVGYFGWATNPLPLSLAYISDGFDNYFSFRCKQF
jgi:uncharacterized membrane protein